MNRNFYRISLGITALLFSGLLSISQAQQKPRLYVSVLQTNNFVVGSGYSQYASGLFSYDGDTTWTHYGWAKNRLNNMSYNPSNPETMFMACGDGVFRSENGGKHWMRMTGWSITEVQNIVVDPHQPNNVYIATAYGVWRSNDNGASWDSSSVGLDSTYVQTIQVDHQNGSYLLTGGQGGIYRSTNGARSWTHVGPNVPVKDIKQSFSNPELWIAGTDNHGVLISRDAGKTWQFLRGRISGKTIYGVAIDPNDPNRMAAAGYETGVYISTNGGRSWIRRTRDLPTKNFHSLIFDPTVKGRLWAGTYNYGVYSTDNLGKTWKYRGLAFTQIWHMVFVEGTN